VDANSRGNKYNFKDIESKGHQGRGIIDLKRESHPGTGQLFYSVLPPGRCKTHNQIGDILALIAADVINRRKFMQGFPVQQPGQFQKEGYEEAPLQRLGVIPEFSLPARITPREKQDALVRVFIHLYRQGVIYSKNRQGDWYVYQSLQQDAISQAINHREIVFSPGKWTGIFLSSCYSLGDLRITDSSRQGMPIPVYYCRDCSQRIIIEKSPGQCPSCGSRTLTMDNHVFHERFIEALLTIYPSYKKKINLPFTGQIDLVIATPNLLGSWLRYIMGLAFHLFKENPFREVLILGLPHNEKRDTNRTYTPGISVQEYGIDALRFALMSGALTRSNFTFQKDMVKRAHFIIRKLWNAGRFVLMQLQGDEDVSIDRSLLGTPEKWILHSLNNTIEKVTVYMDNNRLQEAAKTLYRFLSMEFCNWYLEFCKVRHKTKEVRQVLKFTFISILILCHPFIPFITDEMSRWLKPGHSLLASDYATLDSRFIFFKDFSSMELLKKMVKTTRRIRSDHRIHHKTQIPVILKSDSPKEKRSIIPEIELFSAMVNSPGAEIVEDSKQMPRGFKRGFGNWEILVPILGETKIKKELARLKRELDIISHRINHIEEKLKKIKTNRSPGSAEVLASKRSLQESIGRKESLIKAMAGLKGD